ncbi:MAG: hypothetical protein Q8865_07600 [Bacillota bacterium]|nr:hypothetical protein [Bacillota bacterium]
MPRLAKSDNQKRNDYLLGTMAKQQIIYDLPNQSLSLPMGVSRKTVYNRLNDPDKFTLAELRMLIKKLHIPAEDMLIALGYEK